MDKKIFSGIHESPQARFIRSGLDDADAQIFAGRDDAHGNAVVSLSDADVSEKAAREGFFLESAVSGQGEYAEAGKQDGNQYFF